MTQLKRLSGSLSFQVLMVAIISRIAMMFVNWFGLLAIPKLPLDGYQRPDNLIPDNRWIDGFARWDTAWYVAVMHLGYGGPAGEAVQQRGFFPLYPLISKFLVFITGKEQTIANQATAAVITANVCFLIAVVVFAKIVDLHYSRDVAFTACVLLCVSPLSFFFSAGYSESLFLLTALVAFWFAYDEKWVLAAVAIALCGATRMTGLAMIPAIMLIAWQSRARSVNQIIIPVVGSLGALSVCMWHWWKYDDFFAYTNAQQTFWADWYGRVGYYKDLLLDTPSAMVADAGHAIIAVNLALAVIWLVSLIWVWRYVEPGMALFTTIMVVFHISYTWMSLGRYVLPAMGAYIVWAKLLTKPGWNTWVRESVVIASTILMAMFLYLFGHGFWLV